MSLLHLLASIGAGACTLALVWFAGDFIHSRAVRIRQARHTRRAPRVPSPAFTLNPAGAPAALLIHGFADSPSVFARLAPVLANAGIAVRALRLDGFGIPPRQMAGITLHHWRSTIDRELATLRQSAPAPVWLIGHSLGGTLAFDAALRHAPRVAGLALVAPLIEPSNARSPLLTSRQWFQVFNHALVFSKVVESRLPPDLHDPDARRAYRTDKFIHRDIYRALFDAIDAIRHRAADWRGPLFAALPEHDLIVDGAATRAFLNAAVNASPKTVSIHSGAGHVLPLDATHSRLAGEIIQAVRRH